MGILIQQGGAPALPTPLPAWPGRTNDPTIALEIFDRLDRLPWCYFVHLARNDRNAPLIRAGEVVVIDQGGAQSGGWYPVDGGLFLIEHRSKASGSPGDRYPRVSREIVQTYRNRRGQWHTGPLSRHRPTRGVWHCSDGPYNDEAQLAGYLIGKVVGIYRPQVQQ